MSVVSATKKYLVEARAELKKVTWPTKQETINNTIVVLIISVLITAFLGGLDYVFGLGIDQIL